LETTVSIYEKLSNPDLKIHIDRVGKILYGDGMKEMLI